MNLKNTVNKRDDIQGLRCIAVLSVFGFHAVPQWVPGGYVGVDIFFVISGYLITQSILGLPGRSVKSDLLLFYAKRACRLLPAATVVLLVVGLCFQVLPQASWHSLSMNVLFSTFYIENWFLAAQSVDYLNSELEPGPLQHFWSLAVEEQFYLVWPVVMLLLLPTMRKWFPICLILSSFSYGLWLTNYEQTLAYFYTYSRVWEIAAGGWLALLPRFAVTEKIGILARTVGLISIVSACFLFSVETQFPGYAALLPVVGTMLLLQFGGNNRQEQGFVDRLLTNKICMTIGDISYSFYLWHWPVLVFLQLLVEELSSTSLLLFGLIITMTISFVSKRYVEDPFRRLTPEQQLSPGKILLQRLLISLFALLGPIVMFAYIQIFQPLKVADINSGFYLKPELSVVKNDKPEAYESKCHQGLKEVNLNPCVYGTRDSDKMMVLVGDSHAAQWIPALREIANRKNWRFESHTKSACPLSEYRVVRPNGKPYEQCYEWSKITLLKILETSPDVVIFAQSRSYTLYDLTDGKTLDQEIAKTVSKLSSNGIPILMIADTPRHKSDPTLCIGKETICGAVINDTRKSDPLVSISRSMSLPLINLNNIICPDGYCSAVHGNYIVWRDKHHLTATYSRHLSFEFEKRMERYASERGWY